MLLLPRRQILFGIGVVMAAPAIVPIQNLMCLPKIDHRLPYFALYNENGFAVLKIPVSSLDAPASVPWMRRCAIATAVRTPDVMTSMALVAPDGRKHLCPNTAGIPLTSNGGDIRVEYDPGMLNWI